MEHVKTKEEMAAERFEAARRETERLRGIPVVSVLADFGFNTWHTRGGLYFSPFHNEKTPSFHIDENRNLWYDWSTPDPSGKNGGDVFEFVRRVKNCGFEEAKEYLRTFRPDLSVDYTSQIIETPGGRSGQGVSSMKIDKVTRPIPSRFLMNYMTQGRRIPERLVNRYCSQVNYTTTYADGNTGSYFAIGFPKIDGNWVLRIPKKNGKLSTGGSYSVITSDGRFAGELTRDKVVIVEGFTSALSLLALKGIEVPTSADLIVLNSVANTKKALEWLFGTGGVKRIIGFYDNDATGDNYTDYVKKEAEARGIEFQDARSNYKDLNDLNDLLKARCEALATKIADLDGKTEHKAEPVMPTVAWHAAVKMK